MPTRRDAEKRKARLSELTAALRGNRTAPQRIPRELETRRSQMGLRGKTARKSEAIERRTKIGKPRKKRAKSVKVQDNEMLDRMVVYFDDLYQQLNEQLRLIAKIQQQVNGLGAIVGRLSETLTDGSVKQHIAFPVK